MFARKMTRASYRRALLVTAAALASFGPAVAHAATSITTGNTYQQSNVGSTVNPDFQGGTLQDNQNNATDANNYTVENFPTNTLDAFGNTTTFSGTFSGAGPLAITDSVGGGSVIVTGTSAIGGTVTINSGATLQWGDGTTTAYLNNTNGEVTNNGTLVMNFGGSGLGGGAISGSGNLVLQSGGLSEFSASTYTGTTTIDPTGYFYVGPGGSISNSSNVIVNGTLDVSGGTTSITTLSGSGTVDLGGSAQGLTLTNASGTFSGVIQDGGLNGGIGGNLNIQSGTETLTGANTFTGTTTINQGATLQLGNGGASGSLAGNIADNGLLQFDYSGSVTTPGTISGNGNVEVVAGTTVVTGNSVVGGTVTIDHGATLQWGDGTTTAYLNNTNGEVVDNGTLAMNFGGSGLGGGSITGSGNVVLQSGGFSIFSASTYTGTTTIDPTGYFYVGPGGSISNSSNVIVNGTLDVSGGTTSITTLSGSGTVDLGGSAQGLTLTNASGTFSGVIQDGGLNGGIGGNLNIQSGTETLTGASTFTGTTTINHGATLQLGDGTGSFGQLAGPITDNGSLVFDAAFNTPGFVTTSITGSGSLTLAGGLLQLSGINTYTGSTTVDTGAALGLVGSGSIASSSELIDNGDFDISVTNVGASIQSLSGSGTVTLGDKTLTLTAASGTFAGVISNGGQGAGGVTIQGGTETVTGISEINGAVTIDHGATLQWGNGGGLGLLINASGAITDNGALIANFGAGNMYGGFLSISGSGSLEVKSGWLGLGSPTSYTGPTTIDPGAALVLAFGGSIADSSDPLVNGIFDISGTPSGTSVVSLSGSGTVYLGNQTLTLTGAEDTFSGVIADEGLFSTAVGGSLLIAGGTEILTGTNTYTGGTTINSGATLQLGDGGATGTVAGDITDNGALKFDYSGPVKVSNAITGAGSAEVVAGDVIVTAISSSFSGGVKIDSGATLEWGDGSNVGLLAGGGVVNDGALIANFGAGAMVGVIAPISGSGSLEVKSGLLGIGAPSPYTGPTTVDAGATLALVFAGSIASSSGILDNGTFDISGAAAGASITTLSGSGGVSLGGQTLTLTNASGTFSGVIANGGLFGGIGGGLTLASGTEVLNGANTYTGLTTIAGGVLEVGDAGHTGASLAGGATVGAAGVLKGHGTIGGAVSNTSGGVVSPGGTIGTLTVGSYTQGANSTLAIEVAPGQASQLNSLGAASLNGTLALTFDAGAYGPHIYEIVAGSPVSGTFSAVNMAGLPTGEVAGLAYTSGQVDLVAAPTAPATAYGGLSVATLDRAQSFASLVEDSFGDAACADGSAARPKTGGTDACNGMRAWAQVIGSTDHAGPTGGGFGFNNKGAGFIGGIDKRWGEGAVLGAAFGYADNDFAMNGALSSANGRSFFGSLYGRWSQGPVQLDGQGYYMKTDWPLSRIVAGYGTATSSPDGDSEGFLLQASAPLGQSGLRPYLRYAYARFSRDAVTEAGVGPLGYDVLAGDAVSSLGEAGFIYAPASVQLGGHPLLPTLRVGVQEDFSGRFIPVSASLNGVSGTDFTVDYEKPGRTSGVVDASVKAGLTSNFQLTGEIRGRFGSGQSEGVAAVGGILRF